MEKAEYNTSYFTEALLSWFGEVKSKRDLPWKNTKDPYAIWISEIILQQTQVKQGLSYYNKFMKTFPDVEALATASEEEVLSCWKGLGYYSRARNLHAAAKYIQNELNGVFPNTYETLLQLKGVGPYSAAAIASFAFKESKAVVDGNVYRVLARCFAIDLDITSGKGKKHFQQLADALIDPDKPDKFNQAIMDFGALVCKPAKPLCAECPIQIECLAFKEKSVQKYPIKKAKPKRKKRVFHFLTIKTNKGFIFSKRADDDIWKGLFELPLIETNDEHSLEKSDWLKLFPADVSSQIETQDIYKTAKSKQLLSHQEIIGLFYRYDKQIVATEQSILTLVQEEDLQSLPVPKIIDQFIKEVLVNQS